MARGFWETGKRLVMSQEAALGEGALWAARLSEEDHGGWTGCPPRTLRTQGPKALRWGEQVAGQVLRTKDVMTPRTWDVGCLAVGSCWQDPDVLLCGQVTSQGMSQRGWCLTLWSGGEGAV